MRQIHTNPDGRDSKRIVPGENPARRSLGFSKSPASHVTQPATEGAEGKLKLWCQWFGLHTQFSPVRKIMQQVPPHLFCSVEKIYLNSQPLTSAS
ncbi:unnamed protein product [Boreogadus saida]